MKTQALKFKKAEFVASEIDKQYFDLQENRFSNFTNAPKLVFL